MTNISQANLCKCSTCQPRCTAKRRNKEFPFCLDCLRLGHNFSVDESIVESSTNNMNTNNSSSSSSNSQEKASYEDRLITQNILADIHNYLSSSAMGQTFIDYSLSAITDKLRKVATPEILQTLIDYIIPDIANLVEREIMNPGLRARRLEYLSNVKDYCLSLMDTINAENFKVTIDISTREALNHLSRVTRFYNQKADEIRENRAYRRGGILIPKESAEVKEEQEDKKDVKNAIEGNRKKRKFKF